jgi:hypothetical protein
MMKKTRKQKVREFRIVVAVAFSLISLMAVNILFQLNIFPAQYSLAVFWAILLGIMVAGRVIFGSEFGQARTTLRGIKEITVTDGQWACPFCHASNRDEFTKAIDATMHCEQCGQLVVRAPYLSQPS